MDIRCVVISIKLALSRHFRIRSFFADIDIKKWLCVAISET